MYVSFLFLIVQHVGIDAGLERRIKHEPVEKIISIACLAEPYVSPHQPEFLQVVADGPFTYPHPAGQFRTAAGTFLPDQPVHPVDPFYVADNGKARHILSSSPVCSRNLRKYPSSRYRHLINASFPSLAYTRRRSGKSVE